MSLVTTCDSSFHDKYINHVKILLSVGSRSIIRHLPNTPETIYLIAAAMCIIAVGSLCVYAFYIHVSDRLNSVRLEAELAEPDQHPTLDNGDQRGPDTATTPI